MAIRVALTSVIVGLCTAIGVWYANSVAPDKHLIDLEQLYNSGCKVYAEIYSDGDFRPSGPAIPEFEISPRYAKRLSKLLGPIRKTDRKTPEEWKPLGHVRYVCSDDRSLKLPFVFGGQAMMGYIFEGHVSVRDGYFAFNMADEGYMLFYAIQYIKKGDTEQRLEELLDFFERGQREDGNTRPTLVE
jgi:hypothetical protein